MCESLLPPSSFQATSSINSLLTDDFPAALWQGSLRLGMFLLDLVEHHPFPSGSGTRCLPKAGSRGRAGGLILLCPFQSFLVFAVMASFQPKANQNCKLETPFSMRHLQFSGFFRNPLLVFNAVGRFRAQMKCD